MVLALVLGFVLPPRVVAGQDPAAVVRDVTVSPDTIEIGDRFDLRFTLELPGGTVAFLPDSLDTGAVESLGAVEWTATASAGGAAKLSVVYPMMAFRTGSLAVPEIDVFVGPSAEAEAAGLSSPEDRVGSWSAFREEPGAVPSARLVTVPGQRVEVATVLALDDLTTAIAPRPPADVSGGDRDWLSTALVAICGLLLAGVATASARDWVAAGRRSPPSPPPGPRQRALTALDDLLDEGLHRNGRTREFYAAWSDVVRRYVEDFSDDWGPAWTSTELMTDLQGRRRGLAAVRAVGAEGVAPEMALAERVKFAGIRPDAETAEEHLRRVRAWIAATADAPRAESDP